MLYVPTFKHNLISVDKLSQDNACHVQFSLDVCEILKNLDNTLVTTGHLDHGIYYLNDATNVPSTAASSCLTAGKTDIPIPKDSSY